MNTLLLIRHALCDGAGERLWGRTPGVHLNQEGRRQATALRDRTDFPPLDAIYSSPLERAVETAQTIAARWQLDVHIECDLNELDFGEWTGRTIAELAGTPRWHTFNTSRSTVSPPGGELMAAVQSRALAACSRIGARHPRGTVALVTHADVIRALLCAINGVSLDRILEFTVEPGSVNLLDSNALKSTLVQAGLHVARV